MKIDLKPNQPRWWWVLPAVAIMLISGVVTELRDSPAKPADAHAIQCARPARTGNATLDSQKQVLYKQCLVLAMAHAVWHQQHDTNVNVAGNIRSDPSYYSQCWKLRQSDRLAQEEALALPYVFVRAVDCLSHLDP